MKQWMSDPIVLICSGILVVGIFFLIWALGKFKRLKSDPAGASEIDDLLPSSPDLSEIEFKAPPMRTPAPSPSAPAVSKEVSERLDGMSQRLAEMQSVLTKQVPAASGSAAGGVGQGFSPETIDKLLKIIGNVIQQVDILQKNVNPAKESSVSPAEGSPSAFTKI